MRKKILAALLTTAFFNPLGAQKPEDLLARWGEKMPIEKAWLHFDRDNYLGGETAWFKAYLYSDYQPDTISTSVYVELVNASSDVLLRKICPVFLGVSSGQLELPDSLTTGSYIIRAYTPTMLNADPSFIFKKGIYIYGKSPKRPEAPREKATTLEFFPEGGNLVAGLAGTVAFKATDENGLPVPVSGRLKNGSGKEIAAISSYHDGMGMFELSAVAGEKYYVTLDGEENKKYYLPELADKGVGVTIMTHPQGSYFEIHQKLADPAFQVAYMIGQMQHHIVFRQDFRTAKEDMQGVINTKNLHSGVLQITFFNKDGMPLAERLWFVNNKEYIQEADLVADTLNFAGKGKNRLTLLLKDTVTGSLSVSVTDPEYQLQPSRSENIYSGLLLTSDLKGYIHRPSYYFSSDNDSVQTALDLVMMTNGWRRFKWSELPKTVAAPVLYKDFSYITLSGKVTLRDVKRPFSEKQLLIMLIGADSARSMQMAATDKQGQFRLDSMLFFGNTRILFSDTRGKKNQYIDVTLSADSLGRFFPLPLETQPAWLTQATAAASSPKWAMDYDAILKASGTMLEGVTLKVRKKSLLQEMDEKYASGMFSGDANRTIDLVNTNEADSYPTIFDYLQNRVPGIDFTSQDGTYVIYYRQTASASSMGPIPMTVYLNEIETDASVIATIPSNQIAFIKVFSNFVGAVGNGAGGVLAIYTKKDADITALASSADMLKYKGYSVVKEFYAPDYSPGKTPADKVDNRITLDWRPDIFINHVDPRIPIRFYNTDRTKGYKVVIEGVTTQGKLIRVEKLITAQGVRGF